MNGINLSAQIRDYCIEGIQGIVSFWCTNMRDTHYGGYYGAMSHHGHIDYKATKGAVLHYRILWTLSSAARFPQYDWCKSYAKELYEYNNKYLLDSSAGGVFWSLDYKGNKLDGKKQIYAQAFAIYGYCAYYSLTGEEESLWRAKALYEQVEKFSYDTIKLGYFEAFSECWGEIDDLRLSDKDANEKKTMNTHLHLLEAYTSLYLIWPNEVLAERIKSLILIFDDYILDKKTGHLGLFFDEQWNRRDCLVSFGHDIEASWLLLEAAEAIKDEFWINTIKTRLRLIVDASMEGLDGDGGLWYEMDAGTNQMIFEKHWWPQAEALVGFCNAWQCTGDIKYFNAMIDSFEFIRLHLIDYTFKEWKWGIYKDYTTMEDEDFAGFWKCPYHNSRALMELCKRL